MVGVWHPRSQPHVKASETLRAQRMKGHRNQCNWPQCRIWNECSHTTQAVHTCSYSHDRFVVCNCANPSYTSHFLERQVIYVLYQISTDRWYESLEMLWYAERASYGQGTCSWSFDKYLDASITPCTEDSKAWCSGIHIVYSHAVCRHPPELLYVHTFRYLFIYQSLFSQTELAK